MNQIWPKPFAHSLPDQVAESIVQRIATGQLATGHKLPSQRQLAAQMGVGLAVVREAVKRLEALNIVGATHGSGTVVRPFHWMPLLYDPSLFLLAVKRIGVRDLWETRRLLEVQIVRLAAERATDENIQEIRGVLDRAVPPPMNYGTNLQLNREFHIAVAKGSQNAVLIDLLTPLLDVRVKGVDHRFTEDMSQRTWAAHEAIYRTIADHDIAAAETAMREHFTIGPIAIDGDDGPLLAGSRKRAARSKPKRSRSRN